MPSMMEIYRHHARAYDEMIAAEDFEHNLPKALDTVASWDYALVVESGVGTGRLPGWYAPRIRQGWCFDRSEHMLDTARAKLSRFAHKLSFEQRDHFTLPRLPEAVDIFVEGWSFGHAVIEHSGNIPAITNRLVAHAAMNVRPGGRIILIETLGTNQEQPRAPGMELDRFYGILESEHGFQRHEVQTDYRFPSVDEAARVMGFFFGDDMGVGVLGRGRNRVPEWTGMWVR